MPVKEACDSGGPKGGTPYVRQTSLLCHMLEFCLGATAGFFQDRSTIVAGTSHIIAIRIDYDFACCVGVVWAASAAHARWLRYTFGAAADEGDKSYGNESCSHRQSVERGYGGRDGERSQQC